jgi:uncharacterized RDD family membrane protein YckC
MSDVSGGDGWWQASDQKWYPPESHPDAVAAERAAQPPDPTPAPAATQPGPAPTPYPSAGFDLPAGVSKADPWLRFGSYLLEGVLILVTLFIGWLIWAAMIGGDGQTPAKKILKLRVIGTDTMQPVGLGRMFWVRGLIAGFIAQIAFFFTLGIIAFMPFWDKDNQNVWDKVSNCYVVVDEANAWNR